MVDEERHFKVQRKKPKTNKKRIFKNVSSKDLEAIDPKRAVLFIAARVNRYSLRRLVSQTRGNPARSAVDLVSQRSA
jgi:hypothetical protein